MLVNIARTQEHHAGKKMRPRREVLSEKEKSTRIKE